MVKIIADSIFCLSESFVRHHNISIIPQVISFGEESYLEGLEIGYEFYIHKPQTAKDLPKTAAPPPELFIVTFERFSDDEPILCILTFAAISGTLRSAPVGLKMAPDGRDYLSIMHADAADDAGEPASYLCQKFDFDEIPTLAVPVAVVTHGGSGVLGSAFFTE